MTTDKRTLAEIRRTPFGLLSEDEINMLDADAQAAARKFREAKVRQEACPGHERISTSTREEASRGWHRGECRHCGADMTIDSGG